AFESKTLRRLRRGECERAQCPSVKAAKEGDELFASRRVHREFQRGFNCFSAAVPEMRARRAGYGNDLVELLSQLGQVPMVIVRAAYMNQFFSLFLNRAHDFRMTVARRTK